MKYLKYKLLVAALMAANATMAVAQEPEVASDTLSVAAQKKVKIAFSEADASDVMVGVSSLDVESLFEKNYFTYANDNLMAYLAGWTGSSIWGHDSYLVLVDGVKRDINNIKPDEIASISLLKGANAVVLYGSHAAKGVLLITTKRGVSQPLKINVRANTGWNVAKSFPEYLSSAEYMYYYNQACKNDDTKELYTKLDIEQYSKGVNPYRYPDVDMYSSDYVKKAYNRTDVTAELVGGSERAQFYTNIGYYRLGSYVNFGNDKNAFTDRFNVRGNVNVDITDYIKANVDANVSFYNNKGSRAYHTGDRWISYWQAAEEFRPNRVAPLIPIDMVDENAEEAQIIIANMSNTYDGNFLGGTLADQINPIANIYAAGNNKGVSRQFQFDAGLDVDMSPITQGLSFQTQFALDYKSSYDMSYDETYATYEPTWANYDGKDIIVSLNDNNTKDVHTGKQSLYNTKSDMVIAFNAHFNYKRTFDEHTFGAIAVVDGFQNRETPQGGSTDNTLKKKLYHADSDANLGLNLSYDFAKKYFVDFNAALVRSAKLPKDTRNGISPSVTVGWNIAKESFLEGLMFDDLTLSASVSKLNQDTDIDGYYLYLGTFSENGAWWGWSGNESMQTIVSTRGENPELDFIKRNEVSFGLRGSLLNKMVSFNASVFKTTMEGMIIQSDNMMPSYMMSYYPESSFYSNINYNEDMRKGVDLEVNFNKKIKEVALSVGVTGSYITNEATKRDDTQYNEEYQKRQGHYLDAVWGYECLGFFANEKDIKKSPKQESFGQTIRPGDLKYKDQNGDGKIDTFDQVQLGHSNSPAIIGFNITAKYKGFTLFVAGNGEFGGLGLKNTSYYCPQQNDKYSSEVRYAWTIKTAASAKYPRLTTAGAQNNRATSDFWTYKKDQVNITKAQLTYDFPATLFDGNKVFSGLQVYVSGSDILKISPERKHLEMGFSNGPQSRFYNLGAKVSF